jgi:hypothetical protein
MKALKKKLRQDKSGLRHIEYIRKKTNYSIIYSCLINNHLIKT